MTKAIELKYYIVVYQQTNWLVFKTEEDKIKKTHTDYMITLYLLTWFDGCMRFVRPVN